MAEFTILDALKKYWNIGALLCVVGGGIFTWSQTITHVEDEDMKEVYARLNRLEDLDVQIAELHVKLDELLRRRQ